MRDAQLGRKAPYAKPLNRFGGAAVLEVVDDFDGNTVGFAGVVYMLHAFQKKSKRGAATPKVELDLIDRHLKRGREGLQAMVRKRETKDIPVTQSSGNVFADMGFAALDEELNKAQLASHIRQVIKPPPPHSGGLRGAYGDRSAEGIGVDERTPGEFLQ